MLVREVDELWTGRDGRLLFSIADWDDEAILATAEMIRVSPERIRREDWVGQARSLADGDEDGTG